MRLGFIIFGAFVALRATFGQSGAQSDQPPSVDAFYSGAVEAMRALPQPQYLAYSMEGQGDGLAIDLTVQRHLVWLEMKTSLGSSEESVPVVWAMRHRTNDYETEIVDEYGRRLVSARAFFDPTWYGAFRALRDGMLMYQDAQPPVSSYATPTPGPTPDLRTIAVVQVIGSAIYRVVDRGEAPCSNGDEGHALHLISRDGDKHHQLVDVVVDRRNMHFCTIRFNVRDAGFTGTVEQHYGSAGGYWLQTDGIVESAVRTFGIMMGHGMWRYRIAYAGFPPAIPPETFLRPPTQ